MLSSHDSSAAPQTVQTASPVCGANNFSASVLGAAIALNNRRHPQNMRPEPPVFQPGTLLQSS